MEQLADCTNFDSGPTSHRLSAQSERLIVFLGRALPVSFLAVCFAATVCTQIALDRRQTENLPLPESNRYLPNGVFLKAALLGYSQAGADLLWLQIVQVMGAKLVHVQDYNWLHQALDVVTTLDPQFVEAYDLGGVMLGELAGRADWSNALLAKGIAANPNVWRLPFLQGFNYFFHLQQYAPAATALAQAARLPGSPSYVSELATRLFVEAHNPQAALLFVDAMLEETANSHLRDSLERRKKEILIEEHIIMIERAVAKYRQRHDEPLTSLVPLVERGFLASIPLEPFGGSYQFDTKTGTVVSTTHRQRLRLHRPADALFTSAG